ncbi:PhzF family phenazine biosynthesis protein [Trinickia caryophylli]|uniref:Phenazine biosynthesis protein PhzF family n=1 Tax=Trinickia caryophylli TaxID=28094 RepID=A0A1X7DHL3_TRICW|nr:PhzF family phenazine biosynthesis protein [Trinickia caryophylli]PMS12373.1 PhzF family phenazine biosynthesis protein [Trinickia caryophylli]TRX16952.1 PhzF family phenazine biosynthesis protein [Trinickia caryophylli]WQE12315.1 PhzF family phenazine biosynthesis protein [Trinickia caryophylli]SMF15190.1 phenazine biosynthesis protein PhzF family [Trinickia caryophylli]GLU31539.1 oxidoreductase [Trinickia caryophylli]
MKLPIYQIDAFADSVFKGNYAAVVPLDAWLPGALMQAIATENNLSETAFLVRNATGVFDIRWFSPITEIAFCGHATLASAFVLFQRQPELQRIDFHAPAVGSFTVHRRAQGLIEMDFPQRPVERVSEVPEEIARGLSIAPREVFVNQQAYIAVYDDEEQVRAVVPHLPVIARLSPRDVAVTAPGNSHDFVSRYFWPASGGDEDPVTGSIHTALAPLWAARLGKTKLLALQASKRGGVLHCEVDAGRVRISGHAVQYLAGTIDVPDA